MIRKLCTLAFTLAFVLCAWGCAEDEHKITQKTEVQTESTATDVSPGEMVVD